MANPEIRGQKAIEVYGSRSRKIYCVIQACLSPLDQVHNSICLLDQVFLSLSSAESVYNYTYIHYYFRYLQKVPGSNEGLRKWDIRVSGTSFGRRNGKVSIGKNMIVTSECDSRSRCG
jgi:hypothetical protein